MAEPLEPEENFAELFEQSQAMPRRQVHPGEKVSGVIVQVGAERSIVDLGDGLDAIIDNAELAPKGETPHPKKGDRVEAYVVKVSNRVAELAMSVGKGAGARQAVEDAYRTGVPVTGKVTEVNRGGYVVEIAGMRAFCPLGQMDTRRIEDPATMIGQTLQFRITELRGDRDVLASRRALLEEEAAGKAAETRKRLEVGARFTGTVTSVREFGAFVDIGGMEGLVPVSQLGFGRVRAQDVVSAGQQVEVEVLRVEPPGPKDRTERITLSMRALAKDPWEEAIQDLSEGVIVRGTVVRVQPFGAFVEIVPGVDGLLHVSAFGKRVASPADVVKVGDEIAVRVDAIDASQRRLSLAWVDPAVAQSLAGTLAPELASAPAPAPEKEKAKAGPQAGMTIRRSEKEKEAAPAAAPAPAPIARPAPAGRPRVLGKAAPVAPTAEALAAPAPQARRPNEPVALRTVLEVKVDKIEPFGLFVSWATGRGLVPAMELELPKGADLRKAYPVGTTLKAAVIETRPDGKVRLSVKQAAQEEERAEANAWIASQQPASGKGFGTFGDLLKKKLGK